MSKHIMVATALGELADKITILEIKTEQIRDAEKLKNVRVELDVLMQAYQSHCPRSPKLDELKAALKRVNEQLWKIEDDIRDCERAKDFGAKFIELARAVYVTNDKRARLKKEINLLTGSALIEEKSYQPY